MFDNDVKEAVGLYKDDKLLGIIALHKDDAVSVCFGKKCYTTDKNQKEIYYVAQAWYSHLIPALQIRKLLEMEREEQRRTNHQKDFVERLREKIREAYRLRVKMSGGKSGEEEGGDDINTDVLREAAKSGCSKCEVAAIVLECDFEPECIKKRLRGEYEG